MRGVKGCPPGKTGCRLTLIVLNGRLVSVPISVGGPATSAPDTAERGVTGWGLGGSLAFVVTTGR